MDTNLPKGKDRMRKQTWLFACLILLGLSGPQGVSAADPRFIDNGDGTITDRQGSLMWAQRDNQADVFWQDAKQWVRSTFPESIPKRYDNWRLPTIPELQSLYREDVGYAGYVTECGQRVKIAPLFQISCILLWSSESALGLPLAFDFQLGSAFTRDLSESSGCRVLAVRTLQ
jgi:hypothetical protein